MPYIDKAVEQAKKFSGNESEVVDNLILRILIYAKEL
jgi:hypothetical protein